MAGTTPVPRTPANARRAAIGRAIAKRRKLARITQVQLAGLWDCPQSVIAEIEAGRRRLDIVEFIEIAALVGFDPVQALGEVMEAQTAP